MLRSSLPVPVTLSPGPPIFCFAFAPRPPRRVLTPKNLFFSVSTDTFYGRTCGNPGRAHKKNVAYRTASYCTVGSKSQVSPPYIQYTSTSNMLFPFFLWPFRGNPRFSWIRSAWEQSVKWAMPAATYIPSVGLGGSVSGGISRVWERQAGTGSCTVSVTLL